MEKKIFNVLFFSNQFQKEQNFRISKGTYLKLMARPNC